MKTAIALGAIFNGRGAAGSADGIPLDTFGAAGADAVLSLFAIWGLSQLVFSVIGVLTLVRYRALVPFMFALLLLEHLARRWIQLVRPIVRTGLSPGMYINLALLALMGSETGVDEIRGTAAGNRGSAHGADDRRALAEPV